MTYMLVAEKRLLASTCLFLLCGLLLPLYMLVPTSGNVSAGRLMPFFAIVLLSSWGFASSAANETPLPISVTFWFYTLVFLGYAPLVQYANDYSPWPRPYSELDGVVASIVILVGCLSFIAGYRCSTWRIFKIGQVANRSPTTECLQSREATKLDDYARWKALWIFSLIILISLPLLIQAIGGPAGLVLTREDLFGSIQEESSGLVANLLLQFLRMPSFIAAAIGLAYIRASSTPCTRRQYALVGGLLVLTALLNNPISTPRFLMGTIAITFILLVTRWNSWTAFRYSTIFLFLFLFAFPISDMFRRSLEPDVSGVSFDLGRIFFSLNFDSFQMTENAIQHYREIGSDWGRNLLGAILFFVPRSLWVDKPLPSGVRIAEFSNYHFDNLSMPLWGEFFIAGGFSALVVGFFTYGVLVAIYERRFERALSRGGVSNSYIFVAIYCGFQILLLRGSLGAISAYISLMVALLFAFASLRFGIVRIPASSTVVMNSQR